MNNLMDEVKNQIEDYIEEIEQYDFQQIYLDAELNNGDKDIISQFTQAMLESDVDPLSEKSNLEFIPSYYLWNYSLIKTLYIPSKIKSIYRYAFNGCKNLEIVRFAEDSRCEVLKSYAFSSTKIKKLVLPESVTRIGECCFKGTKLEELVLPSDITYIGVDAFQDCPSLKKIVYKGTRDNWLSGVTCYAFATGDHSVETIECSDGNFSVK